MELVMICVRYRFMSVTNVPTIVWYSYAVVGRKYMTVLTTLSQSKRKTAVASCSVFPFVILQCPIRGRWHSGTELLKRHFQYRLKVFETSLRWIFIRSLRISSIARRWQLHQMSESFNLGKLAGATGNPWRCFIKTSSSERSRWA